MSYSDILIYGYFLKIFIKPYYYLSSFLNNNKVLYYFNFFLFDIFYYFFIIKQFFELGFSFFSYLLINLNLNSNLLIKKNSIFWKFYSRSLFYKKTNIFLLTFLK